MARQNPRKRRTWRCPDEAALSAYADGALSGFESTHIVEHLASCDACLNLVGFLARAQRILVPDEVPPGLLARARDVARGTAGNPWLAWGWRTAAVMAAGFVLAVGLWYARLTPGQPLSPPATRVAPPAPSVPAAEATRSIPAKGGLPELEVVSAAGPELRWSKIERSLGYELDVMAADGSLVWQISTESTFLKIPASVGLKPGEKYFASVRAHLPDGKAVKSAAVSFQAGKAR